MAIDIETNETLDQGKKQGYIQYCDKAILLQCQVFIVTHLRQENLVAEYEMKNFQQSQNSGT